MKIDVKTIQPPPSPPPETRYVLELTREEASALLTIHGSIVPGGGFLGRVSTAFSHVLRHVGIYSDGPDAFEEPNNWPTLRGDKE